MVAPTKAQSVEAGMDSALRSPRGSSVVASFNEGRKPGLAKAGKDLVAEILGSNKGVSPDVASKAARGAIDEVGSGFTTTARPYYDAAEKRTAPPTWVPKGGATTEAAEYVADSPVYQKGLTDWAGLPRGQKVPSNSILVLDAVKKRMDDMVSASNTPNENTFIQKEISDLLEMMDKVAPTYPMAREISGQGADAVNALELGPLGTMSKSNKTGTQADALFGATNDVEKQAALEAMDLLGPDIPLGLLANKLDTATTKQPIGFGKTALPNAVSGDLADAALSKAGKDSVIPILKAAKAVKPASAKPFLHENTGPTGAFWSGLTDLGKDSVARKLTDPKTIEKLGKMGPVQAAVQLLLRSGIAASGQGRAD